MVFITVRCPSRSLGTRAEKPAKQELCLKVGSQAGAWEPEEEVELGNQKNVAPPPSAAQELRRPQAALEATLADLLGNLVELLVAQAFQPVRGFPAQPGKAVLPIRKT